MDTSTVNLIIGGMIGIVGTLGGAAINGYFNRQNLRIQLQSTQAFESKKNMLINLEQAHTCVGTFNALAISFVTEILLIPPDGYTESARMKLTELGNSALMPIEDVHTKIMIHTPELESNFSALNKAIYELHMTGSAYVGKKVPYKAVQDKIKPVNEECKKIRKAIEEKIAQIQSNALEIKK